MVTIKVPRNKLRGIFFLGSLISPAMNVTLFHASLEKSELIIVAPIAPINANPVRLTISHCLVSELKNVLEASHICVKLSMITCPLKPIANPNMIKAKSANNLAEVKMS